MNPVGQPLHQRPLTSKLILAGILGLILFVMFQIAPQLISSSDGDTTILSKSEIREKAAAFAAEQLGYEAGNQDEWVILYKTDSSFYGYMSREKLLPDYSKNKLDQRYPFDVYHAVLYTSGEAAARLAVDLNMYTGEPVAFAVGADADAAAGLNYGERPAATTKRTGTAIPVSSISDLSLEAKKASPAPG